MLFRSKMSCTLTLCFDRYGYHVDRSTCSSAQVKQLAELMLGTIPIARQHEVIKVHQVPEMDAILWSLTYHVGKGGASSTTSSQTSSFGLIQDLPSASEFDSGFFSQKPSFSCASYPFSYGSLQRRWDLSHQFSSSTLSATSLLPDGPNDKKLKVSIEIGRAHV